MEQTSPLINATTPLTIVSTIATPVDIIATVEITATVETTVDTTAPVTAADDTNATTQSTNNATTVDNTLPLKDETLVNDAVPEKNDTLSEEHQLLLVNSSSSTSPLQEPHLSANNQSHSSINTLVSDPNNPHTAQRPTQPYPNPFYPNTYPQFDQFYNPHHMQPYPPYPQVQTSAGQENQQPPHPYPHPMMNPMQMPYPMHPMVKHEEGDVAAAGQYSTMPPPYQNYHPFMHPTGHPMEHPHHHPGYHHHMDPYYSHPDGSLIDDYRSKQPEPKRHACPFCDKVFCRPSSLKTHVFTHTGEKPFICKIESCKRGFSVLSNLRRHLRVCEKKSFLNNAYTNDYTNEDRIPNSDDSSEDGDKRAKRKRRKTASVDDNNSNNNQELAGTSQIDE